MRNISKNVPYVEAISIEKSLFKRNNTKIIKFCLQRSVSLTCPVIQNDILLQRIDVTKSYFLVYHMSLYLRY